MGAGAPGGPIARGSGASGEPAPRVSVESPMTCVDFIEGFSDYVDGRGAPDFVERARSHRDACPRCRRYEEVFLRGRELLRATEVPEVPEDFGPRLQHRLYHVDDERALGRSSSSSAAALLSIAALLLVAAWSPSLFGEPEVELAPIVVSRPAPRPLRIRFPMPSLLPPPSPTALDLDGRDLWHTPSALLLEYAPVWARYRQGGLVRTGLQ